MIAKNLIYTYVSFASCMNTSWGHGTPVEGIYRTANLAHTYGIPVTWIVNSGSVEVLKDQFVQWHQQYGDDFILLCDTFSEKLKKEELKLLYQREWQVLKGAFPWLETKVGAAGIIYEDLIEALEELDFKGLWGYCWEQSWWDGITHKGIPWGFWYVDGKRWKAPHAGKGRIVGCEWTARDLNLAYHTASPCIYSTDPDDVLRAGLCTGQDIEYWKKLFDEYLRNTVNNEYVYFVQQQESHEMEETDAFAVYPFSHIEESASMLEKFFKYISQYDITYSTLPCAISLYHEKNQVTAPCCMLTNDSPIRPEINAYTMTLGGVGSGPWPETFLYYDAQCQLAFVKGECRPRMFRNYTVSCKSDDTFDEAVPMVIVQEKAPTYERTEDRIMILFSIESDKQIPFGICYWDDLTDFSIQECNDVVEAKIIENKLVFIRFNLIGENKLIRLILKKGKNMNIVCSKHADPGNQ